MGQTAALPARCAKPGGIELPAGYEETRESPGEGWMVTVYDNDENTYEEVITVLMIATACSQQEAYIEAWEVDHFGKCVVHRAGREECQDAAEVIATIGIRVEATPEP